uniref:Homeobox-leucine zipper protein n=1 Tax=Kalanchoe fedtschenkoi TaxID=63787 RepID=A0A7N0UG61_KALFE
MDFLKWQDTEKPDSGKGSKRRLTEDQIRLLETNFSFNKKLDQDLKYHLSQQLNLPPRQIAVWYQNKRARWKTQAMESDHKAMQSKLASVMSHNRKLEREVEKLQEELDQARAMVHASSTSVPAYSCAVSTSGEDDGGSSFVDRSECCLDNELYACVAGVESRHQFLSVAGGFGAFGPSI